MKTTNLTGTAIIGRTVSVNAEESAVIRAIMMRIDQEIEDEKNLSAKYWKEIYEEFFKPICKKFYAELDVKAIVDKMFEQEADKTSYAVGTRENPRMFEDDTFGELYDRNSH